LIDDATCAEVEMPDLAVALLAGRQADGFTACAELRVRIPRKHRTIVGHLRGGDRVAAGLRRNAEAVEDAQDHLPALRSRRHRSPAIRLRCAGRSLPGPRP